MTEENNGGKTGYYDLPLPDKTKIAEYLSAVYEIDYNSALLSAGIIIDMCPQTLNDLIEHKDMKPFQHEIMKATYALNERALKNPKKGSSKLREINKILYYAERGKKLILEEEKVVENSAKPHFKIKVQAPIKKVEND